MFLPLLEHHSYPITPPIGIPIGNGTKHRPIRSAINPSTITTIKKKKRMSESFTPADVASHNNPDKGLYIIIDTGVYDVTNFVDEHPGGAKILKRVAGKDASKQFWKVSVLLLFLF